MFFIGYQHKGTTFRAIHNSNYHIKHQRHNLLAILFFYICSMRVRLAIVAILLIAGLLISLFSKNKLTRFCLHTPLKVLLISLTISLPLWIISGYIFKDSDIKQYMDVNNKDLFFYPFFICFSCAIASYSIFLSKIRSVRKNFLLSFISFLPLPLLISFFLVSSQLESSEYYLQTAYYSLAFILPQTYFFVYFWRREQKGEWSKDGHFHR